MRFSLENDTKLKSQSQIAIKKKPIKIWRNLVAMSIELESREIYISSLEKCKENATKEIPGFDEAITKPKIRK